MLEPGRRGRARLLFERWHGPYFLFVTRHGQPELLCGSCDERDRAHTGETPLSQFTHPCVLGVRRMALNIEEKAVEARVLASLLEDEAPVAELLSYASALEADISLWQERIQALEP